LWICPPARFSAGSCSSCFKSFIESVRRRMPITTQNYAKFHLAPSSPVRGAAGAKAAGVKI
jgi:hypothetical protein